MRKEFYRTDKGKLVSAVPADGQEGFVLCSSVGWQWYFRIYSSKGNFDFDDFKLIHSDLRIRIEDTSAAFYENYYDRRCLDYNHHILGNALGETETDADGQEGYLICFGRNQRTSFRLDSPDTEIGFVDYWLTHHDLEVRIIDSSATFYEDYDGNRWLDHSPEILDYKLEKQFSYSRA